MSESFENTITPSVFSQHHSTSTPENKCSEIFKSKSIPPTSSKLPHRSTSNNLSPELFDDKISFNNFNYNSDQSKYQKVACYQLIICF